LLSEPNPATSARTPTASVSSGEAITAPFLALVERRVGAVLRGDPTSGRAHPRDRVLRDASRHLALASHAKRARPMLVDTLAAMTRLERWTAVDYAAAVELIHTASLLHDDVIDEADKRRGLPTVNAVWGNRIAVLAGDLVLTEALRILRPHGARVVDKAIDTIQEMTRAVGLEVLGRRDPDVDPATWRTMAEGKTGALFGLGAWLVAWPADRAERFDRALRHLGVAFQIADDTAELVRGDRAGETAWQDLATANPTFPVVDFLAEPTDVAFARTLEAFWKDPDPTQVAAMASGLVAAGAVERARIAIGREVAAARTAFGDDVEHGAVQVVLRWAGSLLTF
jgi:geranylgeranyl pyrophosphate synthase